MTDRELLETILKKLERLEAQVAPVYESNRKRKAPRVMTKEEHKARLLNRNR